MFAHASTVRDGGATRSRDEELVAVACGWHEWRRVVVACCCGPGAVSVKLPAWPLWAAREVAFGRHGRDAFKVSCRCPAVNPRAFARKLMGCDRTPRREPSVDRWLLIQ